MKKIFSLLLSFVLCITTVSFNVFAEENESIVYIDSIEGTVGETISIPICIKNNPGIISLVTDISYDNTALKFKGVKKNNDFWESASMTPGGDLSAQPYRVIWYDGLAKSDFAKDGKLAELSFEILKTGSHKIELSVSENDTFNYDFVNVSFIVSNSVINVPTEDIVTTLASTTKVTNTTTFKHTTNITTETTTSTTVTTKIPEKSAKLSLDNMIGKVGETINVPINIKDNLGVISLLIEIKYDCSALKLVNVNKNTDFWDSATMTPGGDMNSQPYRIIWYDGLAKNDFTENGKLAELSFKVLSAGVHEIEVFVSEKDTFNSNFENVSFSVSNGIINVSSESVITTSQATSTTTTSTTTLTTTTTTPTTTTLSTTTSMTTTTSTTTSTTTMTTTTITTTSMTTTTPPSTTEPAYLLGDVNEDGSVDSSDASLVLAEYAKIQTGGAGEFTDVQYKAADVNKDDTVDSSDASKILAYYAMVSTGKKPTWD